MQKKNNKLKTNVICRGRCPQRPEKKEQGITLIALIITIIVMLILVAVTIRTAVNSGLFKHAGDATNKWADAQRDESNIGENVDEIIGQYVKKEHDWKREGDNISCAHCNLSFVIGDYVDYKPDATTKTVTVSANESGIETAKVDNYRYLETMLSENEIPETGSQTFTQESETHWRVIGIEDSNKDGINETLLIKMANPTTKKLVLYGAAEYNNGPDIMNKIAKELYSSDQFGTARALNESDVNNSIQFSPTWVDGYYDGGIRVYADSPCLVSELYCWERIKNCGTRTPDASNTEGKLGSYTANGSDYYIDCVGDSAYAGISSAYGDDPDPQPISAVAATTLFFDDLGGPLNFWLADSVVAPCYGTSSDFYIRFGTPVAVAYTDDGWGDSLALGAFVGFMSTCFSSKGENDGLGLPICPVVPLRSAIPPRVD